jgi:protein TonB
MFETAISYGPPSHRVWTTFIGITGQAILVACAIVIPLWFPAALPRPQSIVAWLSTPLPPPVVPPVAPAEAITMPIVRPFQFVGSKLQTPVNIPAGVVTIDDPPIPAGALLAAAIDASRAIGEFIGVLPPAAALSAAPVAREAAPAAPAPLRYKVGSGVKPAVALSRVTPVYPALAQQMRVTGTVEVEGVVGLDGRIHDLRVKSGHPLLVRAAMDAVAQWVFRPTTLNGEPVEVVQTVVVNFILK